MTANSRGPKGYRGRRGATGAGPTGATGATGPAGSAGAVGLTFVSGTLGAGGTVSVSSGLDLSAATIVGAPLLVTPSGVAIGAQCHVEFGAGDLVKFRAYKLDGTTETDDRSTYTVALLGAV